MSSKRRETLQKKPSRLSRLMRKMLAGSQANSSDKTSPSNPGPRAAAEDSNLDTGLYEGQPNGYIPPVHHGPLTRSLPAAGEGNPGQADQPEVRESDDRDQHDLSISQIRPPRTSAKQPAISDTSNPPASDSHPAGTSAKPRNDAQDKVQADITIAEKKSDPKTRDEDSSKDKDDDPPPSNSITHVGGDGSISYYERRSVYTTPGFEWASSSAGYDWESRTIHYGSDNPTMGAAYGRRLKERELNVEQSRVKARAIMDEAITIAARQPWIGHKA